MEQSFTAPRMSLLTASSAFKCRKRCRFSSPWCYLHCLRNLCYNSHRALTAGVASKYVHSPPRFNVHHLLLTAEHRRHSASPTHIIHVICRHHDSSYTSPACHHDSSYTHLPVIMTAHTRHLPIIMTVHTRHLPVIMTVHTRNMPVIMTVTCLSS